MSESSNSGEKSKGIYSKITTEFKSEVIKEVLKSHCSNPKVKLNDDASELVKEITKALVIEAAVRAARCASSENSTVVTLNHIESALPQIMLDFP